MALTASVASASGTPASVPAAAGQEINKCTLSDKLGLNAAQIGQDRPNQRLATPILALDLVALERNIARMQDGVSASGMALRPHAKTHKSPQIAAQQIAAGALGNCCASLREADVMISAGIPGVLITSPMVGPVKLARLGELLGHAGSPGAPRVSG